MESHNVNDREGSGDSFASLFQERTSLDMRFEPGQRIKAKVIRIGREWIFIDVGGKSEGCIDRREFEDENKELTIEEGASIEAHFLNAKRGDKIFTTKIAGGKGVTPGHLDDAYAGGIPVEGQVIKEIKGGYEVHLAGNTRAFCPYSQIDLQRTEDPATHVDNRYSFKIIEFKEGGKNIILSRRALLEEEQEKKIEDLKSSLAVGMVTRGIIASIHPFGAFIDVGGLQGLIPISEMSWSRVEDVASVVTVGQEVEVEILKLNWTEKRFSFSLKRVGGDPWQTVHTKYQAGATLRGRIVRLAYFGAFVELEPGVEGLIPISLLGGGRRLKHARDVVRENEEIEVRIEKVSAEEKRITLAPLNIELAKAVHISKKDRDGKEDKDGSADYEEFVSTRSPSKRESFGTIGDLLSKKIK